MASRVGPRLINLSVDSPDNSVDDALGPVDGSYVGTGVDEALDPLAGVLVTPRTC